MVELRVLTVYRPPTTNTNLFINELENVFTKINSDKCIIIGYMNIDILKSDAVSTEYLNVVSSAGFERNINEPTREEIRSGALVSSCIDHILCCAP